jgi:hypothetical protein
MGKRREMIRIWVYEIGGRRLGLVWVPKKTHGPKNTSSQVQMQRVVRRYLDVTGSVLQVLVSGRFKSGSAMISRSREWSWMSASP